MSERFIKIDCASTSGNGMLSVIEVDDHGEESVVENFELSDEQEDEFCEFDEFASFVKDFASERGITLIDDDDGETYGMGPIPIEDWIKSRDQGDDDDDT